MVSRVTGLGTRHICLFGQLFHWHNYPKTSVFRVPGLRYTIARKLLCAVFQVYVTQLPKNICVPCVGYRYNSPETSVWRVAGLHHTFTLKHLCAVCQAYVIIPLKCLCTVDQVYVTQFPWNVCVPCAKTSNAANRWDILFFQKPEHYLTRGPVSSGVKKISQY